MTPWIVREPSHAFTLMPYKEAAAFVDPFRLLEQTDQISKGRIPVGFPQGPKAFSPPGSSAARIFAATGWLQHKVLGAAWAQSPPTGCFQ